MTFARETISTQMPEAERNDINKVQAIRWLALYDRKGFRGNNYDVLTNVIQRDGHRSVVDGPSGRNAGQEFYYTTRIWRPPPESRYCFMRDGQPNTFAIFREIVEFARKSGIDLKFFINPIHARMLIALQEAGLWPQYEDWKRQVVATLAEEGERSHAQPFPLWDFSGVNTVTTESIPPAGATTEMRWWWEPSHYRRQAGDFILDRVLNHREQSRSGLDDFGLLLSRGNVEDWISKTRDGVRDYARSEPGEAEIIRERLRPVMEDAEGSNCGYDVQAVIVGSEALRRGEREAAEAAFMRAATIHEADRRQFQELGVPFREKGFENTLAVARSGREVGPKLMSWQEYQTRGNDRLTKGNLEDAVEDYSLAIRLGPPNTALFFLRGTTRLRLERFNEAVDDFEAGLKLDPKNTTLQQLLEQARTGAANQMARSGQEVGPNLLSWQEYQTRGNDRLAKGSLEEAAEDYSSAIRLGPPNTALFFLRGTTLLRLKKFKEAANDFEAGLKLDPKNATLQQLLEQARTAAANPTSVSPQ